MVQAFRTAQDHEAAEKEDSLEPPEKGEKITSACYQQPELLEPEHEQVDLFHENAEDPDFYSSASQCPPSAAADVE